MEVSHDILIIVADIRRGGCFVDVEAKSIAIPSFTTVTDEVRSLIDDLQPHGFILQPATF